MIELDGAGRARQRGVVQLGEVAGPLQQRWNRRDGYAGIGNAIGLHVRKEEQLVAHQRQANGRAKLVLMICRHGGRIPVLGVEGRVAHKLPQAAMHIVCARLQAGVDDCARGVAELGRIVAALHPELRKPLGRGLGHKTGAGGEIDQMIVIVHAIEHVVVLLRALSVGVEVAGARAVRTLRRGRARGQLGDVHPVATAEGDPVDGLRAGRLTGRTLLRLHHRHNGGRGVGRSSMLQRDNNAKLLLHADRQASQRAGSVARRVGGHPVVANLDRREEKDAGTVRVALQHQPCIVIGQRHAGIADCGAGRVLDHARYRSLVCLSRCHAHQAEQQDERPAEQLHSRPVLSKTLMGNCHGGMVVRRCNDIQRVSRFSRMHNSDQCWDRISSSDCSSRRSRLDKVLSQPLSHSKYGGQRRD